MYKDFTSEQLSDSPIGGYYHSALVTMHSSVFFRFSQWWLSLFWDLKVFSLVKVHWHFSETSTDFHWLHSITSQEMKLFSCFLGTQYLLGPLSFIKLWFAGRKNCIWTSISMIQQDYFLFSKIIEACAKSHGCLIPQQDGCHLLLRLNKTFTYQVMQPPGCGSVLFSWRGICVRSIIHKYSLAHPLWVNLDHGVNCTQIL